MMDIGVGVLVGFIECMLAGVFFGICLRYCHRISLWFLSFIILPVPSWICDPFNATFGERNPGEPRYKKSTL